VEVHRSTDLTREHVLVLDELEPDRTYFVRASSADAGGNATPGRVIRFVTPGRGVADRSAPRLRMGTLTGSAIIDPRGLGSVTLAPGGAGRTGTFVSAVLDSRAMADWDRAMWDSDQQGGARLVVSVRIGSTPVPDGTWSAWAVLNRPGARVKGSSRYLQYRLEMSTSTTASPSLRSFGASNNGNPPEPPDETS
jgi:hypothetical protein